MEAHKFFKDYNSAKSFNVVMGMNRLFFILQCK
jgi:hypothetical protein